MKQLFIPTGELWFIDCWLLHVQLQIFRACSIRGKLFIMSNYNILVWLCLSNFHWLIFQKQAHRSLISIVVRTNQKLLKLSFKFHTKGYTVGCGCTYITQLLFVYRTWTLNAGYNLWSIADKSSEYISLVWYCFIRHYIYLPRHVQENPFL